MSTTEEEARAIESVRRFCFDLLDPKATPRVPRAVRQRARAVCKHLPLDLALFATRYLEGELCRASRPR
jgi:hypothetical protein